MIAFAGHSANVLLALSVHCLLLQRSVGSRIEGASVSLEAAAVDDVHGASHLLTDGTQGCVSGTDATRNIEEIAKFAFTGGKLAQMITIGETPQGNLHTDLGFKIMQSSEEFEGWARRVHGSLIGLGSEDEYKTMPEYLKEKKGILDPISLGLSLGFLDLTWFAKTYAERVTGGKLSDECSLGEVNFRHLTGMAIHIEQDVYDLATKLSAPGLDNIGAATVCSYLKQIRQKTNEYINRVPPKPSKREAMGKWIRTKILDKFKTPCRGTGTQTDFAHRDESISRPYCCNVLTDEELSAADQ